MTIVQPRRWHGQPRGPAQIEPGFLRGLQLLANGATLDHPYSAPGYASRRTAAVYSGAPPKPGARGVGASVSNRGSQAASSLSWYTSPARTTPYMVEVPAGSDWTFLAVIGEIAPSGANPGFWRAGSTSGATSFVIQYGATNRPWVRVAGSDILQPMTGPQWTTGRDLVVLCRFVSGARVDVWFDGAQRYSAATTVTTPALSDADGIYHWGLQSPSIEHMGGTWALAGFWSRALSDAEMRQLADEPFSVYRYRRVRVYSLPAASGIAGAVSVALADATAAGTATIAVSATSAATLDATTAAGTAQVALAGAASPTLSAATAAGTATVALAGATSASLSAATVAGTGTVVSGLAGTLSATLSAATAVGTGTLALNASAAPTLGAATVAGAGAVALNGSAAASLAAATAAGTGAIGAAPATGTLAVTLSAASAAGTATVGLQASASATLGAATASGTGTAAVLGAVAATLAAATSSAFGAIQVRGAVGATLGAATVSASGAIGNVVGGTLAVTLAPLSLVAAASVNAGAGTRGGVGGQYQAGARRNVQTVRRG